MYIIPRFNTLDGASELSPKLEGILLQTLEAGDVIHARTRSSDYEIFLLEPEYGGAIVKGGRLLAEPVEAIVNGSTFGGSMLKLGWVGVGLSMEIFANGQRLVTTPVESLTVSRSGNSSEDPGSTQVLGQPAAAAGLG